MRAIMLLGMLWSVLFAEPREALLIGNSNYEYISILKNPKENLKELKTTLEDLDFNVKIKTNLNAVNLEEAIELFANRLARNRSTTGFFYYTGHGCQVERQGYLIPTNINSNNRLKVKHHALKINEMIEKLKASGNRVNMFFLDACRDVPVGTKGSSKGLGQIKNTPKGTLVVYATKDGETAEDNSDFINSIIRSVKEPKQSIRNLPYSISDIFKQGSTSQMPIFSAVDIPKVIFNEITVPLNVTVSRKVSSTSKNNTLLEWEKYIKPSDKLIVDNSEKYIKSANNQIFNKRLFNKEDEKKLEKVKSIFAKKNLNLNEKDLIGKSRCRSIQINNLGVYKYSYFQCRVKKTDKGLFFEKISGSQRTSGYLFKNNEKEYIYLGAWSTNNDPQNIYSGLNKTNNIKHDNVGKFIHKKNKIIAIFPYNNSEYEIYEIVK